MMTMHMVTIFCGCMICRSTTAMILRCGIVMFSHDDGRGDGSNDIAKDGCDDTYLVRVRHDAIDADGDADGDGDNVTKMIPGIV